MSLSCPIATQRYVLIPSFSSTAIQTAKYKGTRLDPSWQTQLGEGLVMLTGPSWHQIHCPIGAHLGKMLFTLTVTKFVFQIMLGLRNLYGKGKSDEAQVLT